MRHAVKGHGRIERRTITTTARLNAHLDCPHIGHVFQVRRERTIDGQTSVETAYGVTSLTHSQADASQRLRLVRGHWGAIENGLHWIRDEVLGEDRSPLFTGAAPQNLAIMRNAVLNWLRQDRTDNITAT